MDTSSIRVNCTAALLAAICWGCQSASKNAYENDPIVLSKRSVEGTLVKSPAVPLIVASAEPVPPALPVSAVVAQPPRQTDRTIPALPVSTEKSLQPFEPAMRSTPVGSEPRP